MVRSKQVQRQSERRRARTALEASELSVCIKIQPIMPVPAQSVFKKQGRVLESYWVRQEKARSDGRLQFVPKVSDRGGLHHRRNGPTMMLTFLDIAQRGFTQISATKRQ